MKKSDKPNVFTRMAESIWGVSYSYLSRPPFNRVRKLAISILGFTVLLIGVAMIVLPGPAIVFIPLGLAILGTEYLWARILLKRLQDQAERLKKAVVTLRKKTKIKKKKKTPTLP